jgi:hypothetical protein
MSIGCFDIAQEHRCALLGCEAVIPSESEWWTRFASKSCAMLKSVWHGSRPLLLNCPKQGQGLVISVVGGGCPVEDPTDP